MNLNIHLSEEENKVMFNKRSDRIDAIVDKINSDNEKALKSVEDDADPKIELMSWAEDRFFRYDANSNEHKYDFDWKEIQAEAYDRGLSDEDIDTVIAELEDTQMSFVDDRDYEGRVDELKVAHASLKSRYADMKREGAPSDQMNDLLAQIQNIEIGMTDLQTQMQQAEVAMEGAGDTAMMTASKKKDEDDDEEDKKDEKKDKYKHTDKDKAEEKEEDKQIKKKAEVSGLPYNTPEEAQQALEEYKMQNAGDISEYDVEQDEQGKFQVKKKALAYKVRSCRIHNRELVRMFSKEAEGFTEVIKCYTPDCLYNSEEIDTCSKDIIVISDNSCSDYEQMYRAKSNQVKKADNISIQSDMKKDISFNEEIEELEDEIEYKNKEIKMAHAQGDKDSVEDLTALKNLLIAEKNFFLKQALDVSQIRPWVMEVYQTFVKKIKPIITGAIEAGQDIVDRFVSNIQRNVQDIVSEGKLGELTEVIREIFGLYGEDPNFVLEAINVDSPDITRISKRVTAEEVTEQSPVATDINNPEQATQEPMQGVVPGVGGDEIQRVSDVAQLKSDVWNEASDYILSSEGDVEKIVNDFKAQIEYGLQTRFSNNEITDAEYNQLVEELNELERDGQLKEDLTSRMFDRVQQEEQRQEEELVPETKKITEAPEPIEGQPEETTPPVATPPGV